MQLWKLLFTITITLFFLSGCNSRNETLRLQQQSARQAHIIQQQQAQINALKARLEARKKAKRIRQRQGTSIVPVKKHVKLKKVEDNNFSSGYMYPQTRSAAKTKPSVKVAQAKTTSVSSAMTRTECIAMIGQVKFDKYTQMFGSESASIKRCKMLRAMRN